MPEIMNFDDLNLQLRNELALPTTNTTVCPVNVKESKPTYTTPNVTGILAELRQDRKEAIKDVFDTIRMMEYYGYIKTKNNEVLEEEKSEGQKSNQFLADLLIGVAAIVVLGLIL